MVPFNEEVPVKVLPENLSCSRCHLCMDWSESEEWYVCNCAGAEEGCSGPSHGLAASTSGKDGESCSCHKM